MAVSPAFPQGGRKRKNRVKEDTGSIVFKIVAYILLVFGLVLVVVPFFIIVSTSLQDRNVNVFSWWPERSSWDAYELVFTSERSNILVGFLNTMWIVVPSMLVSLFVSGLAAFAYAKLHFRAKKIMYAVTIATMSIPGTVLMMPSYLWYSIIGWAQSPLPLIIPGCFGSAAAVFFFTQYFSGIPQSLVEAGQMDGMSFLRCYITVMIPLAVLAFVGQGILVFVGGYNDYMGPLLYLSRTDVKTLAFMLVELQSYYGGQRNSDAISCAGAVVALIPIIVLYLAGHKFFVGGLTAGGVKE